MILSLIVARATNGVIGADGGLPWHISADLKHFKALTVGKPIIMGRRTYDSIGKPLPGRHNIVLTRDPDWTAAGVTVVPNLAEAVAAAGLDVHLDVYGDGPCYGELVALAAELGIEDRVTFHGSVSHPTIMAAFAAADLNLLSTRQEGFGKVLVEGMVHATLPVFAESPASEEISGGSTRGLVFDADDSGELAAHVLALAADRDRWATMAAAAREFGREVTLDRFADRVREMLEHHWSVRLPRPAEPSA